MFPIILFVYNRPDHTKRTLEALKRNLLADQSDLFVFADGPKVGATDEQIEKINAVRKVVESDNWCKNVICHFSDENIGCRDSIINGISTVLKSHDGVIVVEDDIITSPYFLTYMNKALDYYKDRKSVFSISGHSHSPSRFRVPDDYAYDVYASPRLFNWGWGTWSDRWFQADWSMSYFDDFSKREYEKEAFARGGDDMFNMLCAEKNGLTSAWDIQFAYAHFRNHAVSIVPCVSYTRNIGLDGSGTHCGTAVNEDEYEINMKSDVRLLDNLYFDSRIINLQYNVFCAQKRKFWQKAVNSISRKLGFRPPFVIKKKVFA